MSLNVKSLVVASVLAACVGSSSAVAGTIVAALAGGPFTSGDITPLPSTGLDSSNTYDFTFAWTGGTTTTTVAADTSGPTPISQFQLFSGTPGSGSFAAQTSVGPGTSLTFSVSPGDYYVEVQPGQFKGVGGAPSGVPEPAAWAMMLVGLGGLGAAARARRAPSAATA